MARAKAVTEEPQVEVIPEAEVPQEALSEWEQLGFDKAASIIVEGAIGLRNQPMINSRTREHIDTIMNLRNVEDFDDYSNETLLDWVDNIRNNLPRIEREVQGIKNQLSRARAVKNEKVVDFI